MPKHRRRQPKAEMKTKTAAATRTAHKIRATSVYIEIPFHAETYETGLPTETVAPVAIFGSPLLVIVRTTIDCRLDTHRHPKLFHHIAVLSCRRRRHRPRALSMKVDDSASCPCNARTLLTSVFGQNCHSRHTDRLENLCVHVRPLKRNARVHTIYASLFIPHTILSTNEVALGCSASICIFRGFEPHFACFSFQRIDGDDDGLSPSKIITQIEIMFDRPTKRNVIAYEYVAYANMNGVLLLLIITRMRTRQVHGIPSPLTTMKNLKNELNTRSNATHLSLNHIEIFCGSMRRRR